MESKHKPSLSHDWPMVSYMVPLFHGKVPVAKVYGPTPESSEDRAKLFAAAADMEDALISAISSLEQLCDGQDKDNACWSALNACRSALAKARGEQ